MKKKSMYGAKFTCTFISGLTPVIKNEHHTEHAFFMFY